MFRAWVRSKLSWLVGLALGEQMNELMNLKGVCSELLQS